MEVVRLSFIRLSHSDVCTYLHLDLPKAAVQDVSVFLIALQARPAFPDPDDLSFFVICMCMSYSHQQDFLRSPSSDCMQGGFQSL